MEKDATEAENLALFTRHLFSGPITSDDYDRPDPTTQHWVPEIFGGGDESEEELQRLLEERRKALNRVSELDEELKSSVHVGEKIARKENVEEIATSEKPE